MILKAKVNFYMYIFQNNAHGYKMEVLYLYFLTPNPQVTFVASICSQQI